MFSAEPKSNRKLANSPAHQLTSFTIVAQFRVVAVTLSLDSKNALENFVLP
jgi:hypothetical protein